LHLVNQLLDLSKMESGRMPYRPVQSDIVTTLKIAYESVQSWATDCGVTCTFSADPEQIVMDYDPEKIQQIAMNLLSNAIKFNREGGNIALSVSMVDRAGASMLVRDDSALSEANNYLCIRMSDTGTGIPAHELPQIFDRFFQVERSANRRAEGTGIGLALVREYLKLMGGGIGVDSEEHKGSEFRVILPIKRDAVPAEFETLLALENPAYFPRQNTSKTEAFAPEDGDTPVILLVEDNADLAFYLRKILSDSYVVREARDGREGLAMALEEVPDLILSDVMMPGMDGLEMCMHLRSDTRTSHIPIVLLTARAAIESKLEGFRHGADDYIVKPFNPEELLHRIDRLLDVRRRLQKHYQRAAGFSSIEALGSNEQIHPEEDAFLKQIRGIIEANLGDPEFSVNKLRTEMRVGASQLNRKVTALIGCSAVSYIRRMRVERAKQLLLEGRLNITEIAWSTGFEDAAFFSRVFRQETGLTPSAWKNDLNAQNG